MLSGRREGEWRRETLHTTLTFGSSQQGKARRASINRRREKRGGGGRGGRGGKEKAEVQKEGKGKGGGGGARKGREGEGTNGSKLSNRHIFAFPAQIVTASIETDELIVKDSGKFKDELSLRALRKGGRKLNPKRRREVEGERRKGWREGGRERKEWKEEGGKDTEGRRREGKGGSEVESNARDNFIVVIVLDL